MRKLSQKPAKIYGILIGLLSLFFIGFGTVVIATQADAQSLEPAPGEHLITLHDNGKEKGILTSATTLRQALEEAHIHIDPNDMIEPGIDQNLVASSYEVNIYRARPVTVIDGAVRQRVMSPHQTAKQIAYHAGVELRDEDVTELKASSDMIGEGSGIQLTITRATEFTFILYGKSTTAYTQAKTVGDMLKDKDITLDASDTLSVPESTPLTKGMKVEIWRNGTQTITEEQDIAFPVEKVKDMDREVGYREVKTPGELGKRTVTFEVDMQNGQELSRKEIQSMVTKEPKKQVEIVGGKPTFTGDFAAALAKLRSCEGGYNSWNPAGPYYGAYQFNQNTWNTVANPASYGNATPAEQDQAAYNLYLRRGWQPWPRCGAGLPDIYR